MSEFAPTARTEVRRLPKRAVYDREAVYRILDEGLVCHIGFVAEGNPVVIPTGYGRKGDTVYLHGSAASRMLRTVGKGVNVCVTVTLFDGLVLARSAFHHSVNYRSVVIFGTATVIEDREGKLEALRMFTEHVAPGRWQEVRPPSDKELQATTVLALPLQEVSAKVRTGPPVDDEEDYALPVWAGVLPLSLTPGLPIADDRLLAGIDVPEYVRRYDRKRP
jgi:nitroimidazol reductase NimA-like FMN-containing flavoprotein (pyridoxamine 5'-phosphate oxidase superfamily)